MAWNDYMWDAPQRPEYQSIRNADGTVQDAYKLNYLQPGRELNTQALDQIRSRATGTGPSPWAQMAVQQQGLEEAALSDKAARSGANAAAQAQANMSMRGGLSGGARERLNMQGARQANAGMQDVARQGALQRAQIGTQDEQTRNQMLMALPGMELQSLQPDTQNRQMQMATQQYNIGNALKDHAAQQEANMNAYNSQMQAWAANRQAGAEQENKGK